MLDARLPPFRDYHDNEGDHPTDHGAPPAIDLGPLNQSGDQPQPETTGNDADQQKPGAHDPGEFTPPPKQPGGDMDHDVVNDGDKNKSKNDGTTNSDNPAAAPSNPAPDTGPGENTPDIPIFLGPSNVDSPPSSSGPQNDPPQDSNRQDDDGRHKYHPLEHKYPDETYCDHFGEPLINLLSDNGGDGGDASSGAATRQEKASLLVRVTNLNMIKASGMGGMVPTPRTAVPVVMLLGVLCMVPQV